MEKAEVRIVQLEPVHVATVLGYGTGPEDIAIQKMLDWAGAKGLLADKASYRMFGFNNPSPSAGSDQYGYEVWVTVGPEVQADGEVKIKDFAGGLYAVLRCKPGSGENIPGYWQQLVAWVEQSPYTPAHHQWLEEGITPLGAPMEEMVLDLYMPIRK